MPTTISLDDARSRFGEILHAGTRTYREFDDPDSKGVWRPVIVDGEIASYRLHELHKVKKRPRSRRR